MRVLLTLMALTAFSLGCANHHCRLKKDEADVSELKAEMGDQKILVAKEDGSRQCDAKSGVSLEAMAKDLGEIKIHKQFKKNDGMMRIQVCGAPTGMHNVYEIDAKDQEKALNVGFSLWKGAAQ